MANAPAKKSTEVATRDQGGAVAAQDLGRSTGLIARIAARFSIDPDKMLETLRATAFRQRPGKNGAPAIVVTNEHMMMLLVVAEQLHLNPLTRELYAFPQEGGIVPIIGFDGWVRLINEHPQLDSIEFAYPADGTDKDEWWTECTIVRKDRRKPIVIREYLKECYRNTDPWNDMPKRMVRHKALIQCARVAFGFSGVFDPDEGERVYAATIDVTPRGKPETREPQRKSIASTPAEPELPCISLDQATTIADKLKEEGVALTLFLGEWQIGSIEQLHAADFEAALKTIDEQSAS